MNPELAPWTNREILILAGIDVGDPKGRVKLAIRCPLPGHDDKHASAFITATNVFGCAVCTGGSGWPAHQLAAALGISWTAFRGRSALTRIELRMVATKPAPPAPPPRITIPEVRRVWDLALSRALDDDAVESDREAYDYLAKRGLSGAWNERTVGVLSTDMALPQGVEYWPGRSYKLVAPLYAQDGELANLQARAVRERPIKKLSAPDIPSTGLLFANRHGVSQLRREWRGPEVAILGEGITDHWALSSLATVPEFAIAGVGHIQHAFGLWAQGKRILLALDRDPEGKKAVEAAGLLAERAGIAKLGWLRLPAECKDVCEFVARHGIDELSAHIDHALEGLLR